MSCDICYKRFSSVDDQVPRVGDQIPLLLPCGHCYCARCLSCLFHYRSSAPCPKCRMQYQVHNPLSLPRNFKLMEFIEEEKQKSKNRRQNQKMRESEQMRSFSELAGKFCSQSQRLLDVISEVERQHHRLIISKEMEKLRSLSLRLSKFPNEVDDDEITVKQRRNRRKSQSSVQTKQRWRY